MQFKIENLCEHQHLVQRLAELNYQEWARHRPGSSISEMFDRYTRTLNRNQVPCTFVALDAENNLLGFVSIIENDLEIRSELSPWLAALYVLPQYRRFKIASALIQTVIQQACSLNLPRLYVCTSYDWRENLYTKNGFKTLEIIDHKLEIQDYKDDFSVVMAYEC